MSRNFILNSSSPVYIAPEILEEKGFNEKVDVYSYAMIAYLIITGKEPIIEGPAYCFMQNVIKGKRPDLSLIKDKQLKTFLQNCFSKNPKNRPSFDQIIETMSTSEIYTKFSINSLYSITYIQILQNIKQKSIDRKIDVVLFGPPASGKTWALLSYKDQEIRKDEMGPTIGQSFFVFDFKTSFGDVKLYFWDTAGPSRYDELTQRRFPMCDAFIMFTDFGYYEPYQHYIDLLYEKVKDPPLYFAAIKADQQPPEKIEELKNLSKKMNADLFFLSYHDIETINKMFNQVANDMAKRFIYEA